jgi:hypothetical protein
VRRYGPTNTDQTIELYTQRFPWIGTRNCYKWKDIFSRKQTGKQTLVSVPFPTTDIEEMQQYIQHATENAIKQHCPKAKPSAYGKRWWTPDLTALRRNYTWTRNLAGSRRRQVNRDAKLEAATKMARHDFQHAIKRQKKQQWTDFLNDAKTIWKATRYLNPAARSSFGRNAAMKGQGEDLTLDQSSMAKELLASLPEPRGTGTCR